MSTCLIMSDINEIAPCRHGVTQELSNLSWEASDASGWQITRSEEPCRPFSARICWHVLNNVTMCNPSITSGPTQQVKSGTFYFIVLFFGVPKDCSVAPCRSEIVSNFHRVLSGGWRQDSSFCLALMARIMQCCIHLALNCCKDIFEPMWRVEWCDLDQLTTTLYWQSLQLESNPLRNDL